MKDNNFVSVTESPFTVLQNDGESFTSQTDVTRRKIANKNVLKSMKNFNDKIELSDNDFDNIKNKFTINSIEDYFNLQIHKKTNRIEDKYNLKNKSDYAKCNLIKDIEKNNKSSNDNDFLKYSSRYAHEALKCMTKKMHFNLRKKMAKGKKIYPLETLEDSKESENKSERSNQDKFAKVTPTSLQSLSSLDLGEKIDNNYLLAGNSSINFLNKLPKMSYLPRRKKQDRCLVCLYKSLEKIDASLRKTADENKWKKRINEENISIDCDSIDDINLSELKDKENRNDFGIYEKEIKFDATEEKSVIEEKKLNLLKVREPVSMVDKNEESLQNPELKSSIFDGKKIELEKSAIMSLDKSKDLSNSEEDEPTLTYLEDSSSNCKTKYKAPCHVPTTFCHSLESLRGLKLKKSKNTQKCMAINESTESAPTDDDNREIVSKKQVEEKTLKKSKNEKTESDPKPIKKLIKIKSIAENPITDDGSNETNDKNFLRRSSSCANFERILTNFTKGRESTSIDLDSLKEEDKKMEEIKYYSLFSNEEIVKMFKDLEERNVSPVSKLSSMCDMFFNRILELDDNRDKSRDKIAKRLIKLLVESRRYTNPDKFPSDLTFSSKQRPLLNAQRLKRILPLDSYNLIAPLLGMPEHYPRLSFAFHELRSLKPKKKRSDQSVSTQDITDDLIVHPPTLKDSVMSDDKTKRTRLNPYGLFMKKERRKAIVWRPLTEFDLKGYDPEATLRMRADKITTDICKEFCEWLRSLGGLEKDIDETVLKDMFEINFSADVCKSVQINVKEMATVPNDVALARSCQEMSVLATTRKQLQRDAKAESEPKRTMAFGVSMPTDLLFVPPKNEVKKKWLKCKNVPRELETMKVVWDGITHLESVQAFVKWLHLHPEVSPPEIFKHFDFHKKDKKIVNQSKKIVG